MVDECDGEDWVSRRNARLRRPIAELGRVSADGIPYLAPEVQLFYKAQKPRAKDQIDFAALPPSLSAAEGGWLTNAITDTYGRDSARLWKLL